MKIFSFFSKFKFKWWSWEIDTVKLFPFIILVLAFLPILPYEKKDGQLISVMGFEAKENNFYLNLSDFALLEGTDNNVENKNVDPKVNNKPDKYQSHLAKINSYLDKNGIVNNDKYKNYLESKNYSEELKQCLILRNILMTELVIAGETKRILSQWVPSPVPAVWIARLGIFWILELIMNPYFSPEMLEKGAKKCNQFEHLWPSEKYLDLTFEE
tara:strand:+ start:217 stop:858 length:642 start_codon:yes stop_codon:yes gene_type:complete